MAQHAPFVGKDTLIPRQTPSHSASYRILTRRLGVPLLLIASMLWGCITPQPLYPPAKVLSSSRTPPTKPHGDPMPRVITQPEVPPPTTSGTERELRKTESPAETTLLQGKLLYSQGMIQEAWQQWAAIAQFADPSTQPTQAETAWRFLFESYFKQANRDNTPHFLQVISTIEPTAVQSQQFQALLNQQTRERLLQLMQLQPTGSALTPIFSFALNQPAGNGLAPTTSITPILGAAQPITLPPSSLESGLPGTVGPSSETATGPGPAALKVGLLLPLSGKWTKTGEHLRRATKKAVADYPNIPIQLLIADSGDSAESSRLATTDLVAQEVDVVVGPVFRASVLPAIEVVTAHNIPIITLNPQRDTDQPIPGVFSNAFQPEQEAKIMARHAVLEKRYPRIAILAPESEYGRGVAKTFSDEVQALGGSVVRMAFFAPDATDFSPWLKALGAQFDALFLPASAKQVRLIAPQAAYVRTGSAPLALLGTSLWNSPELLTEGTDYLEGAIFCDIDTAAKEQFRQSFRQAWEEDPSTLATLAYDGVALIAQLLKTEQTGGAAWHTGLTRTAGFQGASGPVRLLETGQSRRMYHLFQVNKGQIQMHQPVQDALLIP